MDWATLDRNIVDNEGKRSFSQNRRDVWDIVKSSDLEPSSEFASTLYLGALTAPDGRPVCLEYSVPRPNLWLVETHAKVLMDRGFNLEEMPFNEERKRGRHSGLSSKGFRGQTAWVLRSLDPETTRAALEALGFLGGKFEKAIDRWVGILKSEFPGFEQFDPPNEMFENTEISYKLKRTERLKERIAECSGPSEYPEAVRAAFSGYNLLNQYLMIKFGWDWPKEDLGKVIGAFLDREGADVPDFVADFTKVWMRDCREPQRDHARQVASLFAMHLFPEKAIYFRRTVLDTLYKEATGQDFPRSEDPAEEYSAELHFAQAISQAFTVRGLAPRHLMDVQSTLWIVHNHKEISASGFTREAVEEAMNAFDRYQEAGLHSDVFENFGEPKDYWVRSTRPRVNPVYPSKPLVGFILNKTQLNGGWGQKSDAAAQLHNAGFIIVDKENVPIQPPEIYEHLTQGADRIRLVARNYYVEPAREQNQAQVSIRAGTLANDVFLSNRIANVCQSLKGEKFQKTANVPVPARAGPEESTTTVFTFQLRETTMEQKNGPLNTILYGPPGTGKTYETAERAVRICDGTAPDGREAVMVRYNELCAANRIAFVTFHQSYGYEEFVEGLRPETDDGEEQGGGFRLAPVDGVLKRISDRARISRASVAESFNPEGRQVFKMSLGRYDASEEDYLRDECFENGYILLGYGGRVDWSSPQFSDWQEIAEHWRSQPGCQEASGSDPNIVQVWQLRARMKPGDVIVVSHGNLKARAIGVVSGDYEYVPRDIDGYHHRRAVEWHWIDETGEGIDVHDIYESRFSQQTIYGLIPKKTRWSGLLPYLETRAETGGALPHVLIIDEINRANISKVMGEMITLLEEDKREGAENALSVVLPHSKKAFMLPSNLHILGTMNTTDRSIALLDTALRRRFQFQAIDPDPSLLEYVGGVDLPKVLETINARLEYLLGPDHLIGHAWMMGADTIENLDRIMADKVIPLLREYFHEDLGRVRAVLGGGNAFLRQVALEKPPGLDLGYDEDRYRYVVADCFGLDAYQELILGKSGSGSDD